MFLIMEAKLSKTSVERLYKEQDELEVGNLSF